MGETTSKEMRKCLGNLNLEEAGFIDMDEKDYIWRINKDGSFTLGEIFSGDTRRKRYVLIEKSGSMIIVTIASGDISTARLYFIKERLISEMRSEDRKIRLANHEPRENTVFFLMKVRNNIFLHKSRKLKNTA